MSEIRKYFTSRFREGRLLELDFSQLEVFVLAYLSNDKQLKEDLISGADLHGISATKLFGPNYTPKQRKIAKGLSFQLQYGAGYKSMAKNNGVEDDVAKKFIENYYTRYKGVKMYQEATKKRVEALRESVPGRKSPAGYPVGVAKMPSLTGRIYTFWESDAPDFMKKPKSWSKETPKDVTFSPTQIKNFPVQGFATADIVPLVLGKLYRKLLDYDHSFGKVLMVNTVHDSVVFDCETEAAAVEWANIARNVMEDSPHYLKEDFNVDFDLPLRVEADIGKDWYDMEAVEVWDTLAGWRGA